MFLIYSFLYTVAFVLMLPLFILRREKYASGFWQRLGYLPEFKQDGRPVIWLHCVSVGETNAARPLIDELKSQLPTHRLVVSTTTKTGQELARKIFADKADAVFYFPFDWKFSVRRAIAVFHPSVVLMMETEIWPRFFRESHRSGARVAIVNGRLSEKSFKRYSFIKSFVARVLGFVDLALMQGERDTARVIALGVETGKVAVTGNLKFDQSIETSEISLTTELIEQFEISPERPLIIAASTHSPEEKWLLESFIKVRQMVDGARLMIAPRHPKRFDEVWKLIQGSRLSAARRSAASAENKDADVILLDSIGELRAAYPLAEIVFVGGSLIPHGGQSVLEPAAAGKAIITGPFTHNFDAVVREFWENDALVQLSDSGEEFTSRLTEEFERLLTRSDRRHDLEKKAIEVMRRNCGATKRTFGMISQLLAPTP